RGAGPGMTRRRPSLLLFLLRPALGGGPGRRRLGSERVVGEPVPDLAAAEQRNAKIAAHLKLLTVRTEFHQRAVDRAIARIHDRPVRVGQAVPSHPLDQRQSQNRCTLVRAFAFAADPILVLTGLEEDLDDIALVNTIALHDLEPTLGLAGVLVDLLPHAYG